MIDGQGLYWDYDEDYDGLPEALPLLVLDSEPAPVAKELPIPPPLPEAESSRLVQVRTYFPETWLWNLERTGYVIIIHLYIRLCFTNM